jgi:plastocyanin
MRPRFALSLLAGVAFIAGIAACSDNNSNTPAADVSITSGASTKTTTAFSPNPFTKSLATSGQVTWVNNDGVQHDLESDTGGVFDTGDISPNGTVSHTFTVAGTYAYHCSIHPNMVGTIVITP